MKILNPKSWPRPRGYANGVAARGTQIFVAGQIGWNAEGRFTTDDFAEQTRQALQNICAVLAEAGAAPHHVARMTWYIVDKTEYRSAAKEIGRAYRAVMGETYPAMTLVEVKSLLEDRARVEIEATAVLPEG